MNSRDYIPGIFKCYCNFSVLHTLDFPLAFTIYNVLNSNDMQFPLQSIQEMKLIDFLLACFCEFQEWKLLYCKRYPCTMSLLTWQKLKEVHWVKVQIIVSEQFKISTRT